MKIDFFAKEEHYIDHMVPVFKALDEVAGKFYVPRDLDEYLRSYEVEPTAPDGLKEENPIVVSSHQDIQTVYMNNPKRPIIMMEHGAINFFPNNPSYVGNLGYRAKASLTLAPNAMMFEQTQKALPNMVQEIIGTPKLDEFADDSTLHQDYLMPKRPTVCISFHWDGSHVAKEAGNAFEFYKSALLGMAKNSYFKLVGHAHPRNRPMMRAFFDHHLIPFYDDFEDVMNIADIYVNDCSSTLFEFLVTGKPVVLMNRPDWKRNVDYGARFWRYANVGLQVERGDELIRVIIQTMFQPNRFKQQRIKAVNDLYPYLGISAARAASVIVHHISKLEENHDS